MCVGGRICETLRYQEFVTMPPSQQPASPSECGSIHPTVQTCNSILQPNTRVVYCSRLGGGEYMPSITPSIDMQGWLNDQPVQPFIFALILSTIVDSRKPAL